MESSQESTPPAWRSRSRLAQLALFALIVLASLIERTSAQSSQKALIDLGPGTQANGINAAGQVTGCLSIGAGAPHAFLYAAGTLTDLGTLGGASSCGLAINNSGQITGYADTATDRHAFLYANGMMADLSAVSGMPTYSGLAINSSGDVVGAALQSGNVPIAILYSHGVVTDLFPPNANYVGSVATVVNDSSVIAGYTAGPCSMLCPTYQPYIIENGSTSFLGSDSVFDPLISGINNAGVYVAWGEDPLGFFHGLIYSNNIPLDLGRNTTAIAINTSAAVVGNSNFARFGTNKDVGVLLYNAGVTTDINLPGVKPTGINDAGWIIANHVVFNHAYIWIPSSIGLAPTGLNFGTGLISVPSTQGTPMCGSCAVTLSNASAAAIAVNNIVATQPYSVTHDCPVLLNAGATCTITVRFTAAALGPQPGALTVDAGNTTYASLLMGTGAILMKIMAGNAPIVVNQAFTLSWQAGTGATCDGSGGSWSTPANSLPPSGSATITESVAATYTYSLRCSYVNGQNSQAQATLVVVVQPASSGGGGGSGSGSGGGGGGGGGGSVDQWMLGILFAFWAARRSARNSAVGKWWAGKEPNRRKRRGHRHAPMWRRTATRELLRSARAVSCVVGSSKTDWRIARDRGRSNSTLSPWARHVSFLSLFCLAACGGSSPAPSPTVAITASATTVAAGAPVTLTWNSTGAQSCQVQGQWSGPIALSGTKTLTPPAASNEFGIECRGPGGHATANASVTVVLPQYTVTRIDTVQGAFWGVNGLNDSGGVAGWLYFPPDPGNPVPTNDVAAWTSGSAPPLPPPPPGQDPLSNSNCPLGPGPVGTVCTSHANGINSASEVVVSVSGSPTGLTVIHYGPGSAIIIPQLLSATAIGDTDTIVGQTLARHAGVFASGATIDLGTLGGTTSVANALNTAGRVVGSAMLAGDTATHAFLSDGVGLVDLGELGGGTSAASAVNDPGVVVGYSTTANGETHAFRYADGQLIDIGASSGTFSSATGINNAGLIVGAFVPANSKDTHPFLYSNATMFDLWEIAARPETYPAGVTVSLGNGDVSINNHGQILVPLCSYVPGPPHPQTSCWAVLLTPPAGF